MLRIPESNVPVWGQSEVRAAGHPSENSTNGDPERGLIYDSISMGATAATNFYKRKRKGILITVLFLLICLVGVTIGYGYFHVRDLSSKVDAIAKDDYVVNDFLKEPESEKPKSKKGNAEKPKDHKPIRAKTHLPSNALKKDPVSLVYEMKLQPDFEFKDCPEGHSPVQAILTVDYLDDLQKFDGYGFKKEAKKMASRGALAQIYNLTYPTSETKDLDLLAKECGLTRPGPTPLPPPSPTTVPASLPSNKTTSSPAPVPLPSNKTTSLLP